MLLKEREEKKMYYAAYGSNLNVEQMKFRCPGAEMVGTAVIYGYRLMFKGSLTGSYLTIEPDPSSRVPVGIWKVTDKDVKALNAYEGYPRFYYKRPFNLFCSDGHRHKVFAYIMHEDHEFGIPSAYYLSTCLAGYKAFEFNEEYLYDALEYSKRRCA
jgi:hypothetical protein